MTAKKSNIINNYIFEDMKQEDFDFLIKKIVELSKDEFEDFGEKLLNDINILYNCKYKKIDKAIRGDYIHFFFCVLFEEEGVTKDCVDPDEKYINKILINKKGVVMCKNDEHLYFFSNNKKLQL